MKKWNAIDWVNAALLFLLYMGIFGVLIYVKANAQERDEMKPAIVQAGVVPTIKVPQKNGGTRYMNLYDTAGNKYGTCSAYKGKFDGHTWYVFYDNLAVPAVVHDPLCECQKKP